jgi:hypothetical protein
MEVAQAYGLSVIEHIWKSMPFLLTRLPELMSEPKGKERARDWKALFK